MKDRASSEEHAVEEPEVGGLRRILVVARSAQRLGAELPARLGKSVDCRVTTTTAVAAGRELVLELAPHVLVVDLGLGKKDVLDWVRQVRSDPLRSQLPVLAMGTSSSAVARRHALVAGCDDYIAAPVDFQAMASAINRWLNLADRSPPDTAVRRVRPPREPSPVLDHARPNLSSLPGQPRAPTSRVRHSKPRADDVALVVWFSEEEFRTVVQLAASQGREPADWVRLRARIPDGQPLPALPERPRSSPTASARSRPAQPVEVAPARLPEASVRQDTRRRLLALLLRDGKLFPRFIAERLGVTRTRVWSALQALQESGHVRRCDGPDAIFEATGKPLESTP